MTRSRIRKIARVRSTPHTARHGHRRSAGLCHLGNSRQHLSGIRPGIRRVLGQIIVTAQKREENLQNVPLSIQAIGSEKTRRAASDRLRRLRRVPAEPLLPERRTERRLGICQAVHARCGERRRRQPLRPLRRASACTSMSSRSRRSRARSISTSTTSHAWKRWPDRRARSTARAREAGTVRIITNKPDPTEFKAGYDLEGNSVDHGGTGYVVEGFVNIPISENAAVRLVGWYEDEPGIHRQRARDASPTRPRASRSTTPNLVKEDYNDGENYGARAALKLDLSESWTITPAVMGQ